MLSFNTTIFYLKQELEKKLPGLKSQLKAEPSSRSHYMKLEKTTEHKHSSVLILLYPIDGVPYIVFIKRAKSKGPHSGQIGLPGGMSEPTDKSMIETALREASEEIGINSDEITILGTLTSLYIPVSNITVQPVIGYANSKPVFNRQISEVDEIIEVNLESFIHSENRTKKTLQIKDLIIDAPGYNANEYFIWGATAMIMSEFIDIINQSQ